MIAIRKPRPIVAREQHQRVFIDPELLQRLQNLSHTAIDFGNHVSQNTVATLACSGFGDKQRHVRHWVGQVGKERRVGRVTSTDKRDDPVGKSRGEQLLVGLHAHHFFVFKKRKRWVGALLGFGVARPHVVGIRDTRELIESMPGGQKRWEVTQMPLSMDGRRVAFRFAEFRERGLCTGKSMLRMRSQGPVDGNSVGVATGQQRSPRG